MSIDVNIDGAQKRATEVHVNIGGVWKKASNVSVNIGGVWKDGGLQKLLSYFGEITKMSASKWYMTSLSSNYAMFVGGAPSTIPDQLTVYDANLTKLNVSSLTGYVYMYGTACTLNEYKLFGGDRLSTSYYGNIVDVYNNSLVKLSDLYLTTPRNYLNSMSIGGNALFAGGLYVYSSKEYATNTVEGFTSSLTKISSISTLTDIKYSPLAARVGDYAIFASGHTRNNPVNSADAYNSSLVKTTISTCSASVNGASASIDNYAVFAGGVGTNSSVTAYNSSLVKTTPTVLSIARQHLSGCAIGEYAVFSGGTYYGGNYDTVYTNMDVYDNSLTKVTIPALPFGVANHGSAAVNDYLVIVGGCTSTSTQSDKANVYKLT